MKTKFGYLRCENRSCGARVIVKKNDRGTLSYTCDECDRTVYAQQGTRTYDDWRTEIELIPGETTIAGKTETKPAKKKSFLDI